MGEEFERRWALLSVPSLRKLETSTLPNVENSPLVAYLFLFQTGECFMVMARVVENRAQIVAETRPVSWCIVQGNVQDMVYREVRLYVHLNIYPTFLIPREFRRIQDDIFIWN